MGRRGPAPTPTRLKVLRGTVRNEARATTEVQPEPGPLDPPQDLEPEVREQWLLVIRQLGASGVIRPVDTAALRMYCEAVVRHDRASRILSRTGDVIKGKNGMVTSPYHRIVRDNALLAKAFARELGLTPSARVGLQAPAPPASGGAGASTPGSKLEALQARVASRRPA